MDVIIGAALGDEGKGLMTHHIASRYGREAMVVRFNGGAQAGHTVVTPEGQHHVFHHVGSGTFAGASTFLSRFFISNPILFLQELAALHYLGQQPKVYVDPDSLLTTPYDMMVNQIVETVRAGQRHGSCGVGFAETIERNLHPAFALTVADIENKAKITQTLHSIRHTWLPQRLKALNIFSVPEPWQLYIASDDTFDFYIHQLSLFFELITVSRIDLTQKKTLQSVIFEGAQGLMLDQTHGWFPHVTRSHTGLKNVIELINGTQHQPINVLYVTRSYLTRHGAGPLPHEVSTLPYSRVKDATNVTHPYQGTLRYAWFNLTLLKSFIHSDWKTLPSTLSIHPQLAVTCLDQVDDQITFIENEKIHQASQAAFLEKVANTIGVSDVWCSYGPTQDTLKNIECV